MLITYEHGNLCGTEGADHFNHPSKELSNTEKNDWITTMKLSVYQQEHQRLERSCVEFLFRVRLT